MPCGDTRAAGSGVNHRSTVHQLTSSGSFFPRVPVLSLCFPLANCHHKARFSATDCAAAPRLLVDSATMSSPSRRRLLAVSVVLVLLLPAPGVVGQAPNICGTKGNGPDCSATSASASASNRGAAFEANLLRFQDSLRGMAASNASFLNATFAGGEEQGQTALPSTRCDGRRDMVLLYARCLVRYDDASFFGVADTSPAHRFVVPNPNNFSDAESLGGAREWLAGRMPAAAAQSPARFAFDDEAVVTGNTTTTLYGLAQCTEDLPVEECTRCLASHTSWLGVCCADMDGVRLVGPSCYLRYELMAFQPSVEPLLLQPPPSSAPPQPSAPQSSGKKTYCHYFPECLYHDLDGFCASAACGPDEEDIVRKMVIVGLWCIRMSPSDRPSMSRVVDMLEKTTAAELQLPSDPSPAPRS
ncbi:hypothetical protein HU200_037378 [Digitaria exilis]|uniref:Gnk2-homologous domain-containing protein n=1 Tax=Digitaria exilis TaxID=1010633 RepID=A0A835BER7_9POAL|nr:hypothetical protein HU200_037378 [Digitaria exilis]